MGARVSLVMGSCALGATLLFVGCGTIGIELLDIDIGVGRPDDDGGRDADAGSMDAASMDAGAEDAGAEDAGAEDAGAEDAATEDAGAEDAGTEDASADDASTEDAGAEDASAEDGGPDAADASGRDASADSGFDASDARDSGRDAFVDTGPPPCDLSGTWATKVEVQVAWATTRLVGLTAVEGGSGTAEVWLKHRAAPNGSVVPGSMVGCGLSVPPMNFGDWAGGGRGQVSFDISLFATAPPATTAATFRVNGARFPGDSTSLEEIALLLGATMADPLTGSWPSTSQLASGASRADPDGDTYAGVTLPHLNGGGFTYLPVAIFGGTRSDFGYYAWRVALSATGTMLSCDEIAGQSTVSRFDSHVLGCRRVSGAQCSSAEGNLLDDNRPVHNPGAATYRAIKVSNNDVPCATIRSALP